MKIILKYVFYIIGDIAVGEEKIQNGDTTWGSVIIFLIFLPNIVLIVLAMFGNIKNIRSKDTLFKVIIAGLVQIVSVFRYIFGIRLNFINFYFYVGIFIYE